MTTAEKAVSYQEKVQAILDSKLPKGCYTDVRPVRIMSTTYLKIFFAASDYDINQVRDQKPQDVALSLNVDTLELKVQHWGGNGGQMVYRKIDPNHPRERFLAMQSIKVPFRKPKTEEKFILAAVEKFAERWVETIRENKERLCYQEYVDYSNF